ncbi:MAG TPA: ribosome small subunit-dependent GTPase A [Patescibacteria group bacterium]|nr:ribosome small subunit-dependent GTPase A [Patescibacteria group bacterium]
MKIEKLLAYGWNPFFAREWEGLAREDWLPGRVVADYGQRIRIVSEYGEGMAQAPGRSGNGLINPAVGDWVALEHVAGYEDYLVRCVLPRRTKFSRAAAGEALREQVVAANVDTVFLVQSLNHDFNLRRMERYLISTWDSGATPVIVLTKADICAVVEERLREVHRLAPGVDALAVSVLSGNGLITLSRYLLPGQTVALLGSSGVGKSTLVNALAGSELLKTQEIREDDSRGRHTTTHREIILLPTGGLILDTPGMRALSLWEADKGIREMFGDIEQLTAACRFHDCRHQDEPGCAVRQALDSGLLEPSHWESWKKLQKELAYLENRKAGQVRQAGKEWGKEIAKLQRAQRKNR